MRNRNFILGIAFILILTLIALIGVYVFSPGKKVEPVEETETPFGSTSALRDGVQSEREIKDVQKFMGTPSTAEQAPRLRLLATGPVSGAGLFRNTSDSSETVRYVEKSTGNIHETKLATVGEPVSLSQRTLLRVAQAIWSPNGLSSLTLRLNESSDTVFSYLGTFTNNASTSETTLAGRPLANDIISTAFSPDSASIAYLLKSSSGSTLYTENITTGNRNELWSSPLKNLTIDWSGAVILAYTNPTSRSTGVVWSIEPSTGAVSILKSGNYALAAKQSQRSTKVLYSFREKGVYPLLQAIDRVNGNISYIPTASIVEKCAWGAAATEYVYCAVPRSAMNEDFVDAWYQGKIATDDVLWRFNLATGEATQIADLYEETKTRLDAESLIVSADDQFLLFKTRINDLLWALKLTP